MPAKSPSVVAFVALVFALSIPFWVLDGVFPIELLPGLPLSALAVLAPCVAAGLLLYRSSGWTAVRLWLGRTFDFRRINHTGWLLLALLINPALAVLAYASLQALGVNLPPPAPLTLGVIPLTLFFFVGAVAEELGWTGYATGPLVERWGIARAGLALGLVWAVWHWLSLVQAHRTWDWIALWSLGTLANRLIMTCIYARSGQSVFLAAVFHTLINLCWQLFPVNGSGYDPRVFGLLTLAAALFVIILFRQTPTSPSAPGTSASGTR